jgi:DNA ligase (NAD+)
LNKEDLSGLEGFGEKSINNLLNSIEKSKTCPLWRFILALQIKYVGKETAQLLSGEAQNLENLMKIKKEELLDIEGIGEKAAESIFEFFKDEDNLKEIKRFLSHGVKLISERKKIKHIFSNKTFVLTGSLKNYKREEAYDLIKERGGKVSSSVSKKTDFVLLGEDPGSKYEKAKKLNIKIIKETEFEKML